MTRLLILAIIASLLIGCASSAKKRAQAQQEEAERRQRYESSTVALMAGDARAIQQATEKVNILLSENQPNPPLLRLHNQQIAESAKHISDWSQTLDNQLSKSRDDNKKLRKRAEECEAAQDAPLLFWTMVGILAGASIVVLGTAAAILGRTYPVPLLSAGGNLAVLGWVLGGVSLGLRIFIQSIGPYRWIAGLTVVLCFAFAAVWFTWKSIRGFNNRKALAQVREGIRHAEAATPEDVPVKGLIAEKMDDTTKELLRLPGATPA